MSQDTDHDGHRDLSGAFGRPLTSSLRGLLPPRPTRAGAGEAGPGSSPAAAPGGDVAGPDDEPVEDLDDGDLDDGDLDDEDLDDEDLDDELDEDLDDEVDEDLDDEPDEDADDDLDDADDGGDARDGGDELDERPATGAAAGRGAPANPPRRGGRAVTAPRSVPTRRPAPAPRAAPVPRPDRVPADPPRERAARASAAALGTRPLEPSRTRRPDAARPPARDAVAAPAPAGGGVNRRWGIARIASRDHVDLLVLLALDQGAGSGRQVIARLRADSGDVLDAPEQTVHRTLHRLARNRLVVRRTDASGRITYALSETGRRSMLARVREWRALSRAFGAILSERSL